MIHQTYHIEIVFEKTPGQVFNHINDVAKWWPEDFEGENTQLNDAFIFRTGNAHYSKNKVFEFLPGKKVVWLVTESIRKTDGFDWTGTKFIFELTPDGHSTILRFTYDGFVFPNEAERLIQICDITIKEMLYNFVMYNKSKTNN